MIRILSLLLVPLALSACFGADTTPDYRYRLTVEVETPDGIVSGSSVIEVEQSLGRARGSPANSAIYRQVRGEAVAVDLPDGQTFYVLLTSQDSVDWAGSVMQSVAPVIAGEPFEERFDNVLLIEGEQELPRYWPRLPNGDQYAAYPMMVTFADPADPTSVARVDPDDLAASFGEGVSLRRITVQLTDDPVTSGIEERLGWLGVYPEPSLKPEHGPRDFSLPATLHHGDFRQGVEQ